MNFPIQDQLISSYELGTSTGEFSEPILISQIPIYAFASGILYENGILSIKNLISPVTEAYVENGKLKLR